MINNFLKENKLIVPLVLALIALFFFVNSFNPLGYTDYIPSVAVFIIVNLNIGFFLILLFVVGRNIVKLVFERRRGIFGSKIRSKLVITFVSLVLLPTIIIYVLASGLLGQAVQGWFGSHMDNLSAGASEMTQLYFQQEKNLILQSTKRLEDKIISGENLEDILKKIRQQGNLFAIRVYSPSNDLINSELHTIAVIADFSTPEINLNLVNASRSGDFQMEAPESGETRFIRIYYYIKPNVFVLDKRIEPELSLAINKVAEAYREYQERKSFKGPIKSSYLLILALVTALILLAAIWVAIYISKELTNPIKKLSQAMSRVANGDYETRVTIDTDDEIGSLIKSFNLMTDDIKQAKIVADQAKEQIEAVISKISIGTLILEDHVIKYFNTSFQDILKIDHFTGDLESILKSLPAEIANIIKDKNEYVTGSYLSFNKNNEEVKIVLTKIKLRANSFLIIVDDVSGLQRTQMALAWQEVAKRVAHEIKNPLTPIRLNIERIINENLSMVKIKELASNLIKNVDSIERLSKEFSRYSSLPGIKIEKCDVKFLIEKLVEDYSGQYDIDLRLIFKTNETEIECDPEQIRRVLINILDNSIYEISKQENKKISIKVAKTEDEFLKIEILDNGPGFLDEENKVFTPGYTNKKIGSGLGLSIAKEIIEQHNGTIEIKNQTGGLVILQLPIHSKIKQRKISV